MDITTSNIIITGASSGIGLATAKAAIKKGAKVALVARREDRLNALVADLGPNALAVPCDVTDAAQIRTAIDKIIAAFGRIDVLINNAGRGFYASIEEIDIAAYRALLDLNTIAPLAMMQAVLPQMRRQGSGAIVNVSSGATFGVLPGGGSLHEFQVGAEYALRRRPNRIGGHWYCRLDDLPLCDRHRILRSRSKGRGCG